MFKTSKMEVDCLRIPHIKLQGLRLSEQMSFMLCFEWVPNE